MPVNFTGPRSKSSGGSLLKSITVNTRHVLLLLLIIVSFSSLRAQDSDELKDVKKFITETTDKYKSMSRAELITEWKAHEKDVLNDYQGQMYYAGLSPESGVTSIEELLKHNNYVRDVFSNLLMPNAFGPSALKFSVDYIKGSFPPMLILNRLVQLDHPEYEMGCVERWQKLANESIGEDIIDFSQPAAVITESTAITTENTTVTNENITTDDVAATVDVPITKLVGAAFKNTLNASVAFMGLVTSIKSDVSMANMTKQDVIKAMPYTHRLALASLTGKQIEDMVNDGLTKWPEMIYFSGLELYYIEDEARYVVSKIYDPRSKKNERMEYDKKYVMTAVEQFMAKHVDPSNLIVTTNLFDRNVLADYIKKLKRTDADWADAYEGSGRESLSVKDRAEYEKAMADDIPQYRMEYLSQITKTASQINIKYSIMDESELIKALQPLMDKMNTAYGYVVGLAPDRNITDAASLADNIGPCNEVWGNVSMNISIWLKRLAKASSPEEAKANFEGWKLQYSVFIAVAELLKKKYPEADATKNNVELNYEKIKTSCVAPYKKYASKNGMDKNSYMRIILRGIPYLRKQYQNVTTADLVEELQLNMDRINQAGAMPGFGNYKMEKAEELIKDPQDMYTLWGNKLPSVAFLVEAQDDAEAMLYTESWRNRFTVFMIVGELLQRLFPDSGQAKLVRQSVDAYFERVADDIRRNLPAEVGTQTDGVKTDDEVLTEKTVVTENTVSDNTATNNNATVTATTNTTPKTITTKDEFKLLNLSIGGLTKRIGALDIFLKNKFNAAKNLNTFEMYPVKLATAAGLGYVSKKGVLLILKATGKSMDVDMSGLPENIVSALEKEAVKGASPVEILNMNDAVGSTGKFFEPCKTQNTFASEYVVITTLNDAEKEKVEGLLFETISLYDKEDLMPGGKLYDVYESFMDNKTMRNNLTLYSGVTEGSNYDLLGKAVEVIAEELETDGKLSNTTISFLIKDGMLSYLATAASDIFLEKFFKLTKDLLEVESGKYRTDYYLKIEKIEELKKTAREIKSLGLK
jgi:hypothetical protein